MTAPIVQAQYDVLADVIKRFDDQADDTSIMIRELLSAVEQLRGGAWAGEAATSFYREMDEEIFPTLERLEEAFVSAGQFTGFMIDSIETAEQEAATLFDDDNRSDKPQRSRRPKLSRQTLNATHTNDDDDGFFGSIGGFLGDVGGDFVDGASAVGDWVVDHRDEVALGAAVVAAGALTVATAGAASPLLVAAGGAAIGAAAAGGTTLAINHASPEYDLYDGVLGNTVSGAFAGYGVGSAGAAVSTLRGAATATNWASGVGAATAQVTGRNVGTNVARGLTYARPALDIVGGGSMAVSSGGADILIPDQYEETVHQVSNYVGMGADITNLGLAVGGNRLIRYAYDNPIDYAITQGREFAGNRGGVFQAHHLYPQNDFGNLAAQGFPQDILPQSVLVPTGRGEPFIRNIHVTHANRSIHWYQRDMLRPIVEQGRTLTPEMFQRANQAFMNNELITGVRQPITDLLVWGGIVGNNNMHDVTDNHTEN